MTPDPVAPDHARRNRNRAMLLAIFALFFGSLFIAGALRFSGWRPSGMKNKGEMLNPPADLRADMQAWVGCVAGALEEQEYRRLLSDAGFGEIEVEVTRVYDPRDLADSLRGDEGSCCGPTGNWDESAYARYAASGGQLVSAFVRAQKP